MIRKTLLLALGAAIAAGGWYLFRPERMFLNSEVDEPLEAALAAYAAPAAGPANEGGAPVSAREAPMQHATNAEQVDSTASPIASGRFHPVKHPGAGVATVYRLADGRRILRFTNFRTDNGPDLYVYLVAADDSFDDATVRRAEFVSLGRLKGNRGDQNYLIPDDVDLSVFRSVSVWCRRFAVNFAAAPLISS